MGKPALNRGATAPIRPQPQRRLVLLGASNLTKGIGTVLDTSLRVLGQPLEVLAALGHGRSYGRATRFVGMQLPGIESCGLWRDLSSGAELPTAALVTDIGNDLLYEEPVSQIMDWVRQCLDRLAASGAQTIVTQLPVGNLDTLGQKRFRLVRSLFFPFSRITLDEVKDRALALNEGVNQLALERGFEVIEHDTAWYGFDPIHIRYAHRPRVWLDILSRWSTDNRAISPCGSSLARSLYIRTRTPEKRRFFFLAQRGRKPSARFRDGTSISIY